MALVVKGFLKDYSWGVHDAMVPWLGESTTGPQAELWFGLHPSGPSVTLTGDSAAEVLAQEDAPLLVKILAADQPLSIQVHPDAATAVAGHHGADSHLYADDAEKDEILIALTDFTTFTDWRPPAEQAEALAALGYGADVVGAARVGDIATVLRQLFAPEHAPQWQPDEIAAADGLGHYAAILAGIAQRYPTDPGVAVAALLQLITIAPGQAVYIPAGVVHAHVGGVGLEVMTSSDNVLRLGLTTKPVAIPQAIAALRLDRQAEHFAAGDVFRPAGARFEAHLGTDVHATLPSGSFRVVLDIEGAVELSGAIAATLTTGQAVLVPPGDDDVRVDADSLVLVVRALPGVDSA